MPMLPVHQQFPEETEPKELDSYQNEQHCELLNLLVDEAGAHFETAGSLR